MLPHNKIIKTTVKEFIITVLRIFNVSYLQRNLLKKWLLI